MSKKLLDYLLLSGLLGGGMGGRLDGKKGDRSNNGLPYFLFEHNGKKYPIQAVNEAAAKAKFEKIISKIKA